MPKPASRPAGAPPRLRYMPGLDGLRGMAVAVVVLFHAGHLRGGYLGVDLFFVLSGYLITSLLLAEGGASGTVELVRFWGRRARRLLPALAVMLIGVAAYAAFVAEPEELHRIRWDGVATMLYVANWREVFAGADYWSLFTAPSPLAHTWSLAIEEQFYLVWPLVVIGVLAAARRIVGKRRRAGTATDLDAESGPDDGSTFAGLLLWVCVGLGFLALGAQVLWQYRDGWNRVYFGTDTRAFALLSGAAVACFRAWRRGAAPSTSTSTSHSGSRMVLSRRLLEVAGMVGAVVLTAAFVSMSGDSLWARRGGLALCSVAGAAVVAAVSHPVPGVLTRAFTFRPLRWLGLISYGVYLYHWPIAVWLSRDRLGMSGWPLLAVQVAVTLTVAIASYRFIEQPIRHGARWPLRRTVLVPSAGFVAVGALVLAATVAHLPETVDVSPEALAKAAKTTVASNEKSVMVVGNSVARYLAADGFAEVESDPAIRVVNQGRPACQYPQVERIEHQEGSEIVPVKVYPCDVKWLETAEAYDVDYVIFARNGVEPDRYLIDGQMVGACSEQFEDLYARALRADIAAFAERGATVVLVTSAPGRQHFGQPIEVYRAFIETTLCGNDVLRQVAESDPGHVRLVDLQAHLCPTPTTCALKSDGTVLREDGTHFKGAGARIVAAWILEQVGFTASPG